MIHKHNKKNESSFFDDASAEVITAILKKASSSALFNCLSTSRKLRAIGVIQLLSCRDKRSGYFQQRLLNSWFMNPALVLPQTQEFKKALQLAIQNPLLPSLSKLHGIIILDKKDYKLSKTIIDKIQTKLLNIENIKEDEIITLFSLIRLMSKPQFEKSFNTIIDSLKYKNGYDFRRIIVRLASLISILNQKQIETTTEIIFAFCLNKKNSLYDRIEVSVCLKRLIKELNAKQSHATIKLFFDLVTEEELGWKNRDKLNNSIVYLSNKIQASNNFTKTICCYLQHKNWVVRDGAIESLVASAKNMNPQSLQIAINEILAAIKQRDIPIIKKESKAYTESRELAIRIKAIKSIVVFKNDMISSQIENLLNTIKEAIKGSDQLKMIAIGTLGMFVAKMNGAQIQNSLKMTMDVFTDSHQTDTIRACLSSIPKFTVKLNKKKIINLIKTIMKREDKDIHECISLVLKQQTPEVQVTIIQEIVKVLMENRKRNIKYIITHSNLFIKFLNKKYLQFIYTIIIENLRNWNVQTLNATVDIFSELSNHLDKKYLKSIIDVFIVNLSKEEVYKNFADTSFGNYRTYYDDNHNPKIILFFLARFTKKLLPFMESTQLDTINDIFIDYYNNKYRAQFGCTVQSLSFLSHAFNSKQIEKILSHLLLHIKTTFPHSNDCYKPTYRHLYLVSKNCLSNMQKNMVEKQLETSIQSLVELLSSDEKTLSISSYEVDYSTLSTLLSTMLNTLITKNLNTSINIIFSILSKKNQLTSDRPHYWSAIQAAIRVLPTLLVKSDKPHIAKYFEFINTIFNKKNKGSSSIELERTLITTIAKCAKLLPNKLLENIVDTMLERIFTRRSILLKEMMQSLTSFSNKMTYSQIEMAITNIGQILLDRNSSVNDNTEYEALVEGLCALAHNMTAPQLVKSIKLLTCCDSMAAKKALEGAFMLLEKLDDKSQKNIINFLIIHSKKSAGIPFSVYYTSQTQFASTSKEIIIDILIQLLMSKKLNASQIEKLSHINLGLTIESNEINFWEYTEDNETEKPDLLLATLIDIHQKQNVKTPMPYNNSY